MGQDNNKSDKNPRSKSARSKSQTGGEGFQGPKKRRRRRPNKRSTGKRQGQNNSEAPKKNQANEKTNPNDLESIVNNYGRIQEEYLNLRRKFFETHYRLNGRKKQSLEQRYFTALKKLRDFERRLPGRAMIKFEKYFKVYEKDQDYSQANNLSEIGERVSTSESDPQIHLNETQLGRQSFQEDSQESEGTIEDFQAYKDSNS